MMDVVDVNLVDLWFDDVDDVVEGYFVNWFVCEGLVVDVGEMFCEI